MVEKRRTTVYIDQTLHDLATYRNVNLSKVLEDSLKYSLEVADERDKVLTEKNDLLKKIAVLNSKLEELAMDEEKKLRENQKKDYDSTVDTLRKKLKINVHDLVLRKEAIDIIVEKFGLTRSEALKELGL